MRFHLCETDLGWVGLVLSPSGLRGTTLFHKSRDEALRAVLALGARDEARAEELGDLPNRLRRYARGEQVSFSDSLDFADTTPFRRAVWQATQEIPRGQTRSYGWLAERVGRPGAARAVGQAMATNPWPIVVPCHRVVTSDGGLGGYGGGLDMKERLLRLEGARR